jgi:NAD(P)-dependent dehydrogenase (short-subunit alcohol dehydrogenase family)
MGMESLRGQTALITGSARRIGRAIALRLADEGVNIVIHYHRSCEDAHELADIARQKGVQAWLVHVDLNPPDAAEQVIAEVCSQAGSLDILVNNASIFPPDTLDDITFTALMDNMRVNAWSPFALCRAFARQAARGKIVNLLDSRVTGYDWKHVSYILSKHVLWEMTRMLALQYAPQITVNGIAPGLILPPPGESEAYLDRLVDTVPLKRHGDAEDIADAALFLLTSTFITGEVIYVDGGRHLRETVQFHAQVPHHE